MFGKFLLSKNYLIQSLHRPYSQSLYHSNPKKKKVFLGARFKGILSFKSLYRTIMQHANTQFSQTPWKKLWKLNAPKRIKMFLWRMGENMLRRLEVTDFSCVLCGEEIEITCYIFFKCTILTLHLLGI